MGKNILQVVEILYMNTKDNDFIFDTVRGKRRCTMNDAKDFDYLFGPLDKRFSIKCVGTKNNKFIVEIVK